MVGGTNKGNTGYETSAGIKDKNKVNNIVQSKPNKDQQASEQWSLKLIKQSEGHSSSNLPEPVKFNKAVDTSNKHAEASHSATAVSNRARCGVLQLDGPIQGPANVSHKLQTSSIAQHKDIRSRGHNSSPLVFSPYDTRVKCFDDSAVGKSSNSQKHDHTTLQNLQMIQSGKKGRGFVQLQGTVFSSVKDNDDESDEGQNDGQRSSIESRTIQSSQGHHALYRSAQECSKKAVKP